LSLRVGDRLRACLEVVRIGKPAEMARTYSFQGVFRVIVGGRVARGSIVEPVREHACEGDPPDRAEG